MAENNVHDASLRFEGSLWVNIDIALRRLDHVMGRVLSPLRLTVIEWYILRALFEQDGQHASALARTVGRAATSFTPNLDKLQAKGLIERRPDPTDRRAVHIYLTHAGHQYRNEVLRTADQIEAALRAKFSEAELDVFLRIMAQLQSVELSIV